MSKSALTIMRLALLKKGKVKNYGRFNLSFLEKKN